MQLTRRVALIGVVILTTAGASATTAQADSPPGLAPSSTVSPQLQPAVDDGVDVPGTNGPADYLSGSKSTGSTAGGAVCGLPVEKRTGHWWCPTTTPQSAALVLQHAQAAGVDDAAVPASSYCTVEGCWSRIDDAHTTYTGTGDYGTNLGLLGYTEMYFKLIQNGARHNSYPFWFSASRGTASTILSGERLYISDNHPGGNRMDPPHYFQRSFGVRSGGISAQWKSPGPTTYENTVVKMTVVHEAAWTDVSSQYPGSWYMFGKSIIMYHHKNGSYHAISDSDLPADPTGAGWRP